jgi:Bax protein
VDNKSINVCGKIGRLIVRNAAALIWFRGSSADHSISSQGEYLAGKGIRVHSMKRYQRSAIALVGILVTVLVLATVSRPPTQFKLSPKAILHLIPAAKPTEARVLVEPVKEDQRSLVLQALVQKMAQAKARTVYQSMRDFGYQLESVLSGENAVPRLFLVSLPDDMAELREVRVKKALFIKMVLPLVLQVNEEILSDRRRFHAIRHVIRVGQSIRAEDRLWLQVQTERYGAKRGDLDRLFVRMDIIPPSLALAQAVEESGWGTSRFVREGNALFGQYGVYGKGALMPSKRAPGKRHYIQAYSSLIDSVRSYAFNLNTHGAYKKFRQLRAVLRLKGEPPSGKILADTLTYYSARGKAYIRTLHILMTQNNLMRLDDLRLHPVKLDEGPII